MRSWLAAVVIGAGVASLGCGSSASGNDAQGDNRAPVIDGIDAPSEVELSAAGVYKVQFKITFHDDDKDAVTTIRVRVAGADVSGPIDKPNPEAFAALGNFELKGSAEKKTYDVQMSVIDARGAESAPALHRLTLK